MISEVQASYALMGELLKFQPDHRNDANELVANKCNTSAVWRALIKKTLSDKTGLDGKTVVWFNTLSGLLDEGLHIKYIHRTLCQFADGALNLRYMINEYTPNEFADAARKTLEEFEQPAKNPAREYFDSLDAEQREILKRRFPYVYLNCVEGDSKPEDYGINISDIERIINYESQRKAGNELQNLYSKLIKQLMPDVIPCFIGINMARRKYSEALREVAKTTNFPETYSIIANLIDSGCSLKLLQPLIDEDSEAGGIVRHSCDDNAQYTMTLLDIADKSDKFKDAVNYIGAPISGWIDADVDVAFGNLLVKLHALEQYEDINVLARSFYETMSGNPETVIDLANYVMDVCPNWQHGGFTQLKDDVDSKDVVTVCINLRH